MSIEKPSCVLSEVIALHGMNACSYVPGFGTVAAAAAAAIWSTSVFDLGVDDDADGGGGGALGSMEGGGGGGGASHWTKLK